MKQILIFGAALLAISIPASAQTMPAKGDLMPPVSARSAAQATEAAENDTHPTLSLMPDKSELVRLDRDAASVVIGNPAAISVMLDTPRLAVIIPRSPGATYFTALDGEGKVIMQRHVIVAAPKKNYIRVRRSCANAGPNASCKPTSVYFCPDLCHEVDGSAGGGSSGAASSSSAGTPAAPPAPQ